MSIFRSFRGFFVPVIFAPLVGFVFGGVVTRPAFGAKSCGGNFYRNYTTIGDPVVLATFSYPMGGTLPSLNILPPTRSGFNFLGTAGQYYDSSLTPSSTPPDVCLDSIRSKWDFIGCDAGVVILGDRTYPSLPILSLRSSGSGSSSSSGWSVSLDDAQCDQTISGISKCSAIPGGYSGDITGGGYSTATISQMAAAANGSNCWCRITGRGYNNHGTCQQNDGYYTTTHWVYAPLRSSGLGTTRCSLATCSETCAKLVANTDRDGELFRETLYGWNCPFKITYNGVTGTHSNPESYTFSDVMNGGIALTDATSDLASTVFDSWTDDDNNNAVVTLIGQQTVGNRNFTANYNCANGYTEEGCAVDGITGSKKTDEYFSNDGLNRSDIAFELVPGEWQGTYVDANNNYFRIRGKAVCSISSSLSSTNPPSSTAGQYCWCKPLIYFDSNNDPYGLGTVGWFLGSSSFSNAAECLDGCASKCVGKSGTVSYKCDKGCQLNVYKLSYVLNQQNYSTTVSWPNSPVYPSLYTVETPAFTISNPTRDSFTLNKWCENSSFTSLCALPKVVTPSTSYYGDRTYYARWVGNTIHLEWYKGANHTDQWTGSGSNPASCVYGSPYNIPQGYGINPLRIPTLTGYTFDGWEVSGYTP